MSETVHYKGTAKPVKLLPNQTQEEFAETYLLMAGKTKLQDYYKSWVEYLADEFYDDFFYHAGTKTLYKITKVGHDLDEEIIRAEKLPNGTIEYELRYYNGGAGFSECLEEAMDKIGE